MATLKKRARGLKKGKKMDLATITAALRGQTPGQTEGAPQGAMPDDTGVIKARLMYRKYTEDAMTSGQEPMPFADWLSRMRGGSPQQAQQPQQVQPGV